MKTAAQVIKEKAVSNKWLNELTVSEGMCIVDIMQEYATLVAQEALKDAAENGKITIRDNEPDSGWFIHLQGNKFVSISRDSILSTPIKTP